jgi:5-formyltetrahydrofolate cyclo-ligase
MNSGDELPRRKAELRREVAASLRALAPPEFAERGRRAVERLRGVEEFRAAARAVLYASMPDEIDTAPLIEDLLAAGREVYLPVCHRTADEMNVVRVSDPRTDLSPGRFGILEPRAGLPAGDPAAVDFLLAPGRAFDRNCRRLGRGRGFYDRFLAEAAGRGCFLAAVALDLQVFPEVPAGEHDLPVDLVATESTLIRAR